MFTNNFYCMDLTPFQSQSCRFIPIEIPANGPLAQGANLFFCFKQLNESLFVKQDVNF